MKLTKLIDTGIRTYIYLSVYFRYSVSRGGGRGGGGGGGGIADINNAFFFFENLGNNKLMTISAE
jgi:hypothetical protein